MVRAGARVSPLVSVPATRDTVSEDFAGFRSHRERRGDLLVPKDQYSVIIDFSAGLEVLGDRIAINIRLVQRLQAMRFRIIEELRRRPLLLRPWRRGKGGKL